MVKYYELACPKCGATDEIYEFYPRYEFNRVTGVNPKTGGTDGEFIDLYDNDDVPFKSEDLERFAHCPGKRVRLSEACHVWQKPRAERINPVWKMTADMERVLGLKEEEAFEICQRHFKEGATIADIYEHHLEDAKSKSILDEFVRSIMTYHPMIKESVAKEIAEQYAFKRPLSPHNLNNWIEMSKVAVFEFLGRK